MGFGGWGYHAYCDNLALTSVSTGQEVIGTYSKTSWSPDGSKILYMLTDVCNEDIGMVNSDGSSCIPFIDGSIPDAGQVTQAC